MRENTYDLTREIEQTLHNNGVGLCRLGFQVMLFVGDGIDQQADAITRFHETVLLSRQERFRFYQTETMRDPEPLSSEALEMVPFWVKSPHAVRTIAMFDCFSEPPESASPWRFELATGIFPCFGLRMTIPLDFLSELDPDPFTWCCALVDPFDFAWGVAGLTLLTPTDPPDWRDLEEDIRSVVFRHPGIDLGSLGQTRARAHAGIKSCSWITFVGKLGLEHVPEAREPGGAIETFPLTRGIAYRLGEQPYPGDVNRKWLLPEYQRLTRLLQPIMTTDPPDLYPLDEDAAFDWIHRFDEGEADE